MDFILGLIVGFFSNWIGLGFAFTAAIFLFSRSFNIVSGILWVGFMYGLYLILSPHYDISWWKVIIIYFCIGIPWSIISFKRYVAEKVEKFNKMNWPEANHFTISNFKTRMSAANNSEMITWTILMFPLDMTLTIFKDSFDFLDKLVTVYIRNIYDRISQSEISKITVREKKS